MSECADRKPNNLIEKSIMKTLEMIRRFLLYTAKAVCFERFSPLAVRKYSFGRKSSNLHPSEQGLRLVADQGLRSVADQGWCKKNIRKRRRKTYAFFSLLTNPSVSNPFVKIPETPQKPSFYRSAFGSACLPPGGRWRACEPDRVRVFEQMNCFLCIIRDRDSKSCTLSTAERSPFLPEEGTG